MGVPLPVEFVTRDSLREAVRLWSSGTVLPPTQPGATVAAPSVSPASAPDQQVLSARRVRGVLVTLTWATDPPGEGLPPWAVLVCGDGTLQWARTEDLRGAPLGVVEGQYLRALLRALEVG